MKVKELYNLSYRIEAYKHEQLVFERLLRKRGSFTDIEFDSWFINREYKRPSKVTLMDKNTIIIGLCGAGVSTWSKMLELLQIMMRLEIICCTRNVNGGFIYYLKSA